MKRLFGMIVLCAMCSTATGFAAEIMINGQFAKNKKGNLLFWRAIAPRNTVSMEVTPASNGKGNALFVETDGKSYQIGNEQRDIRSFKKLNFSIFTKGSGGFAVSLLCYDETRSYITTNLLFEARANADKFQEFTKSFDIPDEFNGKKIVYVNVMLLTFPNSQIIYENAVLNGIEH